MSRLADTMAKGAGRAEARAHRSDIRARGIRLAMVAPSLDILGGQGVQARSLAQALYSDGVSLLFVPVNPRFPLGLRWLRRLPVLRTLLNQCLYLVGLLRLRRVDVVHIFSAAYWSFVLAPLPAILLAKLLGKRIVLNYHSGEADDHLANWGARVHPWLRLVDDIVVPSVYLQEVFARHGYTTTVVRNIVDTSDFHYRQRHSLQPRLLSNRNLERHYRVDMVLRAFAMLKQQRPDARLVVAGYGSQSARLQQWVRTQGLADVTFVGRVEPEAMPRLYDEADIFVNASVIDNQPISLLEAFAAGLPVVSTDTGDIANMLAQGEHGSLVPQDQPEMLAAAILELLEQPEAALEKTRKARAEVEQYAWTEVREQWMTVYRRGVRPGTEKAVVGDVRS